jgi:hypothetical protein
MQGRADTQWKAGNISKAKQGKAGAQTKAGQMG